ncbi:MAG: DUF2225 domain-containing protein [Asgard group archaeon]|nr:DUF2225 domain-containing protein [Asgard group archaeon]
MPLLLDEQITCPKCSHSFETKILASYDTFGDQYSDLYIASENDPQPILHKIQLCPKCGFAAFTLEFNNNLILQRNVKKVIKKIENFTGKSASEFNVGDGYLEIAEYSSHLSLEERSHIMMQACYAYRELEDSLLSKARKKVLQSIQEIIENSQFKVNDKEVYYYLTGELLRLLGNNQKAEKYFNKTLTIAQKRSFIARLTKHQLTTPSEIIPENIRKAQKND